MTVDPPAGWVHSTAYWWVEDDTLLGSLRIRHTLTPGLLQTGGHIACDTGNVGSRKIIEHSGGRFEDERAGRLRYWVPTG
ncbi:GNAT family N-acetyltransferase [Jatrophihabitans lederbergiae]|uniref:GNAT family N-acetyltransferase n=1 Tax=Jatrophihabitans lederbergiae TaxID=3075547 RepID=A0ABU2J8C9_9ACTN|nr:hypothetical protein [Jatrophihabitans sp. DSM 44399]MDT0260889.1 hypothetical protein [Jatrophihabitans sp. DSM 44399]